MPARRCTWCARNWPLGTLACPQCGGETWHSDAETAPALPPTVTAAAEADETLDQVEAWRLGRLLEAGYPTAEAHLLAALPWHEVDLHRAVELVAAGCPAEIAARILL